MDDSLADVQNAMRQFQADYDAVRTQVQRVIVGQEPVIDGVLTCLFTGGHVLLEGAPGLGKTLLVRSLAKSLSLSFGRIQFTPDLMPADVTGTTVLTEGTNADGSTSREFSFRPGPIFAQIVLADEINRATPKTQAALLEAMQEHAITIGSETHTLDEPFLVMATQNPIEQEGTYPLPEAQLDRFFFKVLVPSAGREDLAEIIDRTTAGRSTEVEPVLTADRIVEHQQLVQQVAIAPHVKDYAIRVVLATHPAADTGTPFATPMVTKYARYGASPRGAQTLVLAGKCRALVNGRPTVSTDDIQAVATRALRHRIALNFEGEAEGITTDDLIDNIVQTIPVEGGAL